MPLEEEYLYLKNKIRISKKQHRNTKTMERRFIMVTNEILAMATDIKIEAFQARIEANAEKIRLKANRRNRIRIWLNNFNNSIFGLMVYGIVATSIVFVLMLSVLLFLGV